VAVETSGQKQKKTPHEAKRSVQCRPVADMVDSDHDRSGESRNDERHEPESLPESRSEPTFCDDEDRIAADGSDADNDGRDREGEQQVERVQAERGLESVGQLARAEQHGAKQREDHAERSRELRRHFLQQHPQLGRHTDSFYVP
jgi:hypothetical protein